MRIYSAEQKDRPQIFMLMRRSLLNTWAHLNKF